MLYPQNLATPYGATPFVNTLNTLYGNAPQNPTLAQSWLQPNGLANGLASPQSNGQQAFVQQALQQQAAQQLAQQLAANQLIGQPFASQQLTPAALQLASQAFAHGGLPGGVLQGGLLQQAGQPLAAWSQQGGQQNANPALQQQTGQQTTLYQLAQYHYLIAQQLAQLAAQQQQLALGYFGSSYGGQMIPGQQINPGQQFIPGLQFMPNQFGQNVAPGMTVH